VTHVLTQFLLYLIRFVRYKITYFRRLLTIGKNTFGVGDQFYHRRWWNIGSGLMMICFNACCVNRF